MKTYTATATREGRYWVVDVEGVGVTQGRNLKDAQVMAADLVSIKLQVPIESFAVILTAVLDPDIERAIAEAKAATAEAEAKQREAAAKSRKAVKRLKRSGLTGVDTATVLGVSAQRVSQLAPSRAVSPAARKSGTPRA